MAPVAVPSTGMEELKIDEPKVEKKVDVNEEEDDEDEDEGEGGETGATAGMPFVLLYHAFNTNIRCKEEEEKEEVYDFRQELLRRGLADMQPRRRRQLLFNLNHLELD